MEENNLVEIDFVINLYELLTNNNIEYVKNEILEVTNYVRSFQNDCKRIIVKVILETCYLNDEQIQELTGWCCGIDADFVKTSTGYGTRGVSDKDLKLMKPKLSNFVELKASGGIKTFEQAMKYIQQGATRIGTSSSVNIMKEATATKLKELNITKEQFAQMLDHTNLTPTATDQDIKKAVQEAIKNKFKTICIRPKHIQLVYDLTKNTDVRVCIVIGFGNLKEKDSDSSLTFERYNATIEQRKAEIDHVFDIIKIEF